ncbi:MAG: hypothetical protein O7F17_08235 [Planctomycetota bacterium]|nr:hypothetical protein [Planctomycetota bacterium]
MQTICGLRQRHGLALPPSPSVPAFAPPRVALANLRDWLIQVEQSAIDPAPEPDDSLSDDSNEQWIDCRTAAQIWERSKSWWRSKVDQGKPISRYRLSGKTKLFRFTDAEQLARSRSIGRRGAQTERRQASPIFASDAKGRQSPRQ